MNTLIILHKMLFTEPTSFLLEWIFNNIIGIIGIIISGIIAYHVYYLSQQLNLRDKLTHKDGIKTKLEPLINNIRTGISIKVELVNTKKYEEYYPHDNSENYLGWTYMTAEFKETKYNGVEFFEGVKDAYKIDDRNYTFNKEAHDGKNQENIFSVGLIPYEWIEYVDIGGDEFSYRPQLFVKFSGLKKTPYQKLFYYAENQNFKRSQDPPELKYKSVEILK